MNQLRAQSIALMDSRQLDNLKVHLDKITIRMQESIFENAKFTCRLFSEISTLDSIDKVNGTHDEFNLIRETFSVHVPLVFFVKRFNDM